MIISEMIIDDWEDVDYDMGIDEDGTQHIFYGMKGNYSLCRKGIVLTSHKLISTCPICFSRLNVYKEKLIRKIGDIKKREMEWLN